LIAHGGGCEGETISRSDLTIIWLIESTTGTLLLSWCSDDLKRWFVCNLSNQFTYIYLLQRDRQHLARSLADGSRNQLSSMNSSAEYDLLSLKLGELVSKLIQRGTNSVCTCFKLHFSKRRLYN
jgi:hypothetical protein